jgi:hypothetical protein
MTVQTIASKYRRALRNGTGMTLTAEQLRDLAEHGLLLMLAQIEAQELCPAKKALTGATPTGSTKDAMANPPSGKSQSRSGGQSYIEALAR